MRTISIDYNENDPIYTTSYKGVVVSFRGRTDRKADKRFFTGNIAQDFLAAKKFMASGDSTLFASSVDHFCYDVEGFHWIFDSVWGELIAWDVNLRDHIPEMFKVLSRRLIEATMGKREVRHHVGKVNRAKQGSMEG
jgi:hypothetical protein